MKIDEEYDINENTNLIENYFFQVIRNLCVNVTKCCYYYSFLSFEKHFAPLFLDLSSRNKNLGNQLKNLDGNLSFFIRNTFHRQFFLRLFNEPSSSLCHHDETRPLHRVNRS